ncbi:MAG: preprotein translocase subunit SecE [Nitrospirae bacterium]|nr:preprotein translocase subunit SecE [Nitrospirota bacterium]
MSTTLVAEEQKDVQPKQDKPSGPGLVERVRLGSLTRGAFSPARWRESAQQSLHYFREVWQEMKSVTWPGRKEVTLSTGVVLLTCVGMMAVLWILDILFAFLMGRVLG